MKKTIVKIITLILSFLLGIVTMSYIFNKGNLDLTAHMPEAELPVLYVEEQGELINPSYGYTGKIDAACLRSAIVPLYGDRIVQIAMETYGTEIRKVSYEVRSTDMERLIQNGDVEHTDAGGQYWQGRLKVKDLLEDGEEYALIFHVETAEHSDVKYFARVRNSSGELVSDCRKFASEFHDATLDKENDYPITQYLENDQANGDGSLEYVTIHSRYRNVIWGDLPVKESKAPVATYLELEDDILSLRLDYEVAYEGNEEERYKVSDYFRVRRTETRMYLLDYERTAERIFTADGESFDEQGLNLGIQRQAIPYMANEEGNVVNFAVSGELWSYDAAQNKLSKVFSFKDGSDSRGLHDEFEICLINMDDSGSMDFAVTGYMNRGRHEGRTGMLLMRYDSLTKTTEELLFIESSECYGVLADTAGKLLYVSHDDKMYLSYGTQIYTVDLKTKNAEILAEGVSSENSLISADADMLAWQHGDDPYQSSSITTMNMQTGVRHTYTADEGEYLRPLGFIGEDFIYGIADGADVSEDLSGNAVFPMYRVEIVDSKGSLVRDFEYLSKNKYVISASVQDNRIDLECVTMEADGSLSEALPEPITSNAETAVSTIALKKTKDELRQNVYRLTFETRAEGRLKKIVPKQILFEEDRTISLEADERTERFHGYARGRVTGVYEELKDAVPAVYETMGVVTDADGQVVFRRGSRRGQVVLSLAEHTEGMDGAGDSLEAALGVLLQEEGKYADIRSALDGGSSAYEILRKNSDKKAADLTGCTLQMMLYYLSEGQNVLAVTGARSAELIVGYDPQNVLILDPVSGAVRKEGLNDAAERYVLSGGRFISFLK